MGSFVSFPVIFVMQKLFGSIVHHETNGLIYWMKWLANRISFYLHPLPEGRFSTYDFTSTDPYKNCVLIPDNEYDIEKPQPKIALQKKSESNFFFGTNSSGQCLVARICRHRNRVAEVWLYLRLSNSESYIATDNISVDMTDENGYSSAGLRFQCLLPMRRWRIAFNGLARLSGSEETVHLKFSFICYTVARVADYQVHYESGFLSHILSEEGKIGTKTLKQRIHGELDGYSVPCHLLGTVTVNLQEEREVYLWGHREKTFDRVTNGATPVGQIFGFTKNGLYICIKEIELRGAVKRLTYGGITFPTSQVRPIRDCSSSIMLSPDRCKKLFKLRADRIHMDVVTGQPLSEMLLPYHHAGEIKEVTVKILPLRIDDNLGHAVFIGSPIGLYSVQEVLVPLHLSVLEIEPTLKIPLVLSFDEAFCQKPEVTGGKGSSLAVLMRLSKRALEMSNPFSVPMSEFQVPNGLVVTTSAYEVLLENSTIKSAIQELEDVAYKRKTGDLQESCKRTTEVISSSEIPEVVLNAVKKVLEETFPGRLSSTKFAVRSSACGEDSEEMSAAGQMDTFLGVKGVDEISKAIMKCWASQFAVVATEYKRRYGQPLNSPMAVVIQEMVPAEVAGVMFTCDPVTCNPAMITITANFGLGESVVSASAEPDTVILSRTAKDELQLSEIKVGAKKAKVIMKEDGGTEEEAIQEEDSKASSLDEARALQLGYIGLLVEKEFCTLRDIEWAFVGDQLYLLQARPVTSVDLETDFEIIHGLDTGMISEMECFSFANIGEVMRGAVSPLTVSFLFPMFMLGMRDQNSRANVECFTDPFTPAMACCTHQRVMFSGSNEFIDYTKTDLLSKGFAIAFAGRLMEDDEKLLEIGKNKARYLCKSKDPRNLKEFITTLYGCENKLEKGIKDRYSWEIPVLHMQSSKEIFYEHSKLWKTDLLVAPECHSDCIMYSSITNVFTLALLAHTRGDWDNVVFSDFATLVSSCNNLVSVGVPKDLQELALIISEDPVLKDFKIMNEQEALDALNNGTSKSSEKFRKFLVDHGHRCVNEFDVANKPWGADPLPVVKTLQNMIGVVSEVENKEFPMDSVIKDLDIKLGPVKRFLLKQILKKCRKGIAMREKAKSFLVKSVDMSRKAYRHLADRMVSEGRLPEPDLMFYFVHEEIRQLFETASPRLISRAYRRQRLHPYLESLRFPEMTHGIIKPLNTEAEISVSEGKKTMTGTPVSNGTVVGTARVINTLEEAKSIQRGDILITYSTDIGWSPYFPLLGGVVTELGGLISHGAVVAREYGLPCVVGLHGATAVFKSGEKVLLDGKRGILQSLD